MNSFNLLIFPCGTEIGLELHRCFSTVRMVNLFGAGSVPDHGAYVYQQYTGGLPFVNQPAFLPELKKLIGQHQIDAIFPANDLCLKIIKRLEADLGCRVVSSPAETVDVCFSKLETYQALEEAVPVPRIFTEPDFDSLPYPVFAKPESGHSAIGAKRCNTAEELRAHLVFYTDCLILEYLPGKEYTVDCFTDRHGKLRFAQSRERGRIQNGISVHTEAVQQQEEFEQFAQKINATLSLRGAWFFQVKRNINDELVLMEVAPRIGGSSGLCRAMGVNLPLLSLFDYFDMEVELLPQAINPVLDRALSTFCKLGISYNNVYCDLDDCLIIRNKINTSLLAFLAQCLNQGKRLILLTRHAGKPADVLSSHRLGHFFDEVVHLPDRSICKSEHILPDSIFIDDSHAERKRVQQKGIPVFAPDAIECLLHT